MRILITGCTGQDGAYLSELLLSEGHQVVGTSPRRSSDDANLDRLHLVGALDKPTFDYDTLDVTCSASVDRRISSGGFDEVYNLAAQSFVLESFKSPIATAQINYIGVLNLLDSIRRHSPTTRFYQASTSEMFGLVNCEAQNEATPFHPRSPYGVSKVAAHYAVQNYREAYGMYACSGILFNHESPLRGLEFITRKITDGVARIVANKAPHLYLGNLEAQRDWGDARDYVRGMTLMLRQDKPKDFVLATGITHSVRDVLRVAFSHVNLDYREYVKQDARYMRPSEVPILCGDASYAKTELAWQPEYEFNELITEMVVYDLQRHGIDPVKLFLEEM